MWFYQVMYAYSQQHLNHLASLAKLLSVRLRFQWLWVRVPLQSFMFLLTMYLLKNDLNTVKVIFYYVIGCSMVVYNFILLKSSIEIFYNIPQYSQLEKIIGDRVNFSL